MGNVWKRLKKPITYSNHTHLTYVNTTHIYAGNYPSPKNVLHLDLHVWETQLPIWKLKQQSNINYIVSDSVMIDHTNMWGTTLNITLLQIRCSILQIWYFLEPSALFKTNMEHQKLAAMIFYRFLGDFHTCFLPLGFRANTVGFTLRPSPPVIKAKTATSLDCLAISAREMQLILGGNPSYKGSFDDYKKKTLPDP